MSRTTRPAFTLLAAATLAVGLPPLAGLAEAHQPTVVPDGWVTLEDDTGLLTVAVPPEWTDQETARASNSVETARITAATDIDQYRTGFEAPGLSLVALPYNPDTTGVLDDALTAGCRVQGDTRYDDGAFVGILRHWTSCGDGTSTEVYILAAAPVNRSVTVSLIVQITDPDDREIVDHALASFNLTYLPDPPPPTTTVATTPTTPPTTSPGPPPTTDPTTTTTTTPAFPASSTTTSLPTNANEAQELRDESGALLVEVPASWSDVNLRPAVRNDGVELPNIAASPDLDAFLPSGEDEFLTPGVIYRGLPHSEDTEATLRGIGRLGCVDGGITEYSDDLFTGHMWTFPSCGGTPTRQFIVVANANDGSFTALLVIRVTEPGNRELSAVLGSFTYDSGAVSSSPIATS